MEPTLEIDAGRLAVLVSRSWLMGQHVSNVMRAGFALALLFVIVVSGLLVVNYLKRSIQRHSDAGRRRRPYQGPPTDDWARKPIVPPELESSDLESSDLE